MCFCIESPSKCVTRYAKVKCDPQLQNACNLPLLLIGVMQGTVTLPLPLNLVVGMCELSLLLLLYIGLT